MYVCSHAVTCQPLHCTETCLCVAINRLADFVTNSLTTAFINCWRAAVKKMNSIHVDKGRSCVLIDILWFPFYSCTFRNSCSNNHDSFANLYLCKQFGILAWPIHAPNNTWHTTTLPYRKMPYVLVHCSVWMCGSHTILFQISTPTHECCMRPWLHVQDLNPKHLGSRSTVHFEYPKLHGFWRETMNKGSRAFWSVPWA